MPIVSGMGLFDLLEGDGSVRPGPAEGYAACVAGAAGPVELGSVGRHGVHGREGAGRDQARPGGLGSATVRHEALVVSALVAVNALSDRRDPAEVRVPVPPLSRFEADPTNTTIGVVATNAALSKLACHLAAQSAHDGLARALDPAHTAGDGDAFVVAASGSLTEEADLGAIRSLVTVAVERAILDAFDRAAG